jgi:putative endonuclease
MGERKHGLGRAGEDLAETWYRSRGSTVVARNFRLPCGELDLVVVEDGLLCFVEVKCRRNEPAEGFVSPAKARRVRLLARWYLEIRPWAGDVRFDVVGIHWPKGHPPRIVHLPEAF